MGASHPYIWEPPPAGGFFYYRKLTPPLFPATL